MSAKAFNYLFCAIRRTSSVPALLLLGMASAALGQTESTANVHRRSFGIFTNYSPNSSHILLGAAEQRKMLSIGMSYGLKLHANETLNWQYEAEVLPFALESDPRMKVVVQQFKPLPGTQTYYNQTPMARCHSTSNFQYTGPDGTQYEFQQTYTCDGREWTMGEAISPMGFRVNFNPRRWLQPVLLGHGGYMYSTHAIPTRLSGSFNFRFDVGVGLEVFRTRSQSIRFEYRLQHVSNKSTAYENPGIDSQVLHVAYVFGR